MRTKLFFLCLLCLITLVFSEGDCEDVENPSVDNCKAHELTDNDKDDGDSCCYLKYKLNGVQYNSCIMVTKSKVKDAIKEGESEGASNVSIDCSSNWLNIGLILGFLVLII